MTVRCFRPGYKTDVIFSHFLITVPWDFGSISDLGYTSHRGWWKGRCRWTWSTKRVAIWHRPRFLLGDLQLENSSSLNELVLLVLLSKDVQCEACILHHRDNQPCELIFAGCLVPDGRSWCGEMVIDWCNHKIHKGSDSLPGKELALPANNLKKDMSVFFWCFENYLTFHVLRLCAGNLPRSFRISCVHISNMYTIQAFIFKQPSTSFR